MDGGDCVPTVSNNSTEHVLFPRLSHGRAAGPSAEMHACLLIISPRYLDLPRVTLRRDSQAAEGCERFLAAAPYTRFLARPYGRRSPQPDLRF